MKIIKRSEFITDISYSRFYEWPDCPGAGFGFDCDKDGNIDESQLTEIKKQSLAKAREKCIDRGVQVYNNSYREPAIGLCECGEEVVLHGFTNTCENCNRDYNSAGQELAPREQWGYETGEHWTDCI